jgi:hypothetical protein
MKKVLLAATMLTALASGAKADILGGLDWNIAGAAVLSLDPTVPSGQQTTNLPCLICGAHQPQQPVGMGYNLFGNTGNADTVAFFSTATVPTQGGSGIALDSFVNVTGYSLLPGSPLLTALQGQIGFSVGLDVNDTNTPQTLESFWFLNYTQQTVLAVWSPEPGGQVVAAVNDGTGFPDWTISGLSLAGINPGDTVGFFARITGANDGPDSFFLIPNAIPGPVVGAGLPGLLAGALSLFGLSYWRRRRAV